MAWLDDLIFRRTSFPPDELSAGPLEQIRYVVSGDVDYIGLIMWTGPSVRARPLTPLRTSPRTCIQPSLLDNSLSLLLGEC